MTSRIPEPPSPMEAEGIPDPDDANGLEPPHDTASAVDDFGMTADEQREGESLDGRLSREEDDVLAQAGQDADESAGLGDERAGQGVGRLVEPDEGAHEDTEADMIATDVGTDLGGYSAEEAAMHLEPEV